MILQPCPSSPNCISSKADVSDGTHYMAPLAVSETAESVLDAVELVVRSAAGAEITKRSDEHLEAVFTSRIFRFKDDVRFVVEGGQLHFRSASRLGYSDLGANRKRMADLIPQIKAKL